MISELKNPEGNLTTNNDERKTVKESMKDSANVNVKVRNGPTNGTASPAEKNIDEECWKEVFVNLIYYGEGAVLCGSYVLV